MDYGLDIIYEVNGLLLHYVEQEQIDSVEEYLSSVPHPLEYLNRVYDENDTQKRSLLTMACLNGHIDLMRMLIERFNPDLEIKNNILFGDGNKNKQMCIDVTVLWVAAAINNFEMVQLLVEHGANVNHTTKTNSTPLRSACYNGNLEMARYLIKNGADVHIAKENNDTNLAVSVYRKHLEMARYLVDELGFDVNVCDNDGRPPLYDAVNGGSLILAKFLLEHGARNFPAKCDQMTPLMWAAEKRQADIVDLIASYCPLIEQIESKELLASAIICSDGGIRDFEQAFEYISQALELRLIYNLPKILPTTTNSIFNHRQECQTLDQLNEIHADPTNLCIEALLIRERLLGPKNAEYRYSLRYHGAVLADNQEHIEGLPFWMYELELRQQHSIPIDSEHLRHFASMFSEMLSLSLPISIENLLTVMKITVEELKLQTNQFDFNIHTLIFLITITCQVILFYFFLF